MGLWGIVFVGANVLGKACEEGLVHQVPHAQGSENITLDVAQVRHMLINELCVAPSYNQVGVTFVQGI